MIKYFCDICGKETDGSHICEECKAKQLTYDFKIGDKVITSDGREGVIQQICTCHKCKERGFYEPVALMDDGENLYITVYCKECGFDEFFQIGDYVFDNIDEDIVRSWITGCERKLKQLNKQLALIEVLKYAKEKNNGN